MHFKRIRFHQCVYYMYALEADAQQRKHPAYIQVHFYTHGPVATTRSAYTDTKRSDPLPAGNGNV